MDFISCYNFDSQLTAVMFGIFVYICFQPKMVTSTKQHPHGMTTGSNSVEPPKNVSEKHGINGRTVIGIK